MSRGKATIMADQKEIIYGTILQNAVSKQVSEKLGGLYRELGEFATQIPNEEIRKAAKLAIIEMVDAAAREFISKIRQRLASVNGRKGLSE